MFEYITLKPTVELAMNMLRIEKLREAQIQPLTAILAGQDVVVQMPTSGGKSLLYQMPAIMWRPHLTVVISPLKALQSDQVKALRAKGVEARLLNSSLAPDERNATLRAIREKELTLLYIAPEQLQNEDVLEALEIADIALIAVDEAHVLAHTQDNFRRSYREIGKFVGKLPKRPIVAAFTATATRRDRRTITQSLKMINPTVFVSPIRRDNLHLRIKRVDVKTKKGKTETVWRGKRRMVESALREWNGDGSAIIYCPTVKDVKRLHRWLKAKDWQAGKYHGKMSDHKRTEMQESFLCGKVKIMIATNAFGLGIDKPDVRLIIHAGLPLSMDGYVQEIGRAGRDGKDADCVLIYAPSDVTKNRATLSRGMKKKQRSVAFVRLEALYKLVKSHKCLWREIEKSFDEKPGKKCGKCCKCLRKKHKTR